MPQRNSIFRKVKRTKLRRNAFNLSHDRKFSFRMGQLVPVLCQEVVPGDSFRLSSEIFLRMQPLVAPVMHRVNVMTYSFFVPNRLIWNDFPKFIESVGESAIPPVPPKIEIVSRQDIAYTKNGSLLDYLGFPTVADNQHLELPFSFSALPVRAYNRIWNDYFRDQNLEQDLLEYPVNLVDDFVNLNSCDIRYKAWDKDYFTTAFTNPQKGGDVHIPGGSISGADVILSLQPGQVSNPAWHTGAITGGPALGFGTGNIRGHYPGAGDNNWPSRMSVSNPYGQAATSDTPVWYDPDGSLKVSGGTSGGATINELRRAVALQGYLEKLARGGTRYTEMIESIFGVVSSDARLQRPEFLGGSKNGIAISEVLQTSQSPPDGEGTPQGTMTGHGVSANKTRQFKAFFEEYGFVMTLICVMPRPAYQQGVSKMWTRFDPLEYLTPDFAHLGEQPVYKRELYFDGSSSLSNNSVFGYQSRYSEYKFVPDSVHGNFRDNLDFWHAGRIFDSSPSLNYEFVTSQNGMHKIEDRIFAVPSYDTILCHLYHNLQAIRPLPVYGTPRI